MNLRIVSGTAGEVSFHLANLTAADALWFGELVALFADPARKNELDALRQGRLMLRRAGRSLVTVAIAPWQPGEDIFRLTPHLKN